MAKHPLKNKLNELSSKDWLKFQKSWFVHNPPPRRKNVLRHPAKFPETLAVEFICFFTKPGQVVFDPMAGTGSTLVGAIRSARHAYGIELNPAYTQVANQIIEEEKQKLGSPTAGLMSELITGDAVQLAEILTRHRVPPIDYVLTSPPYWDMLHARGAATQNNRRQASDLDVFYSDDPQDLGNIRCYDEFLQRLCRIYTSMQPFLSKGAYLTIVVKNVKKGGRLYPLAWDLAGRLAETYTLKDEKIWCQDNQRLAPYGLWSAWVSNTFHHYCLQFRNE